MCTYLTVTIVCLQSFGLNNQTTILLQPVSPLWGHQEGQRQWERLQQSIENAGENRASEELK